MTQQAPKSGSVAPAVAPLGTSEERGNGGIRQVMGMDLPVLPFSVDHDWYERYWYGDRSPSMWGKLVTTARSLCREVPRVGSAVARAVSTLDLSHSPLDPHRPA
jgi:hypothetical protein